MERRLSALPTEPGEGSSHGIGGICAIGDLVTVIDYGMGNLRSVAKALEMVGAEVCVSSRADDIARAGRVVLPGVGTFATCMSNLEAAGLVDTLRHQVLEGGKPFLSICLGMQLLARTGYEDGMHTGLGWLDADVVPLECEDEGLKVPHMGWNEVTFQGENPLFQGMGRSPTFYFLHGYHLVAKLPENVVAVTEYGSPFTAAVLWDNVFATQFHPEKSQENDLRLLENFLSWDQ